MTIFATLLWTVALSITPSTTTPAASADRGFAPVFYVGAGAGCDFSSLQAAIDAVPDGAALRLAKDQAYEDIAVVIVDKNLRIEGGYNDCSLDHGPDLTVLDGGAGTVIRVQAATPREVSLRDIHVRGGGDGGIQVEGPVELRLHGSIVEQNATPGAGGGLRIAGSGSGAGDAIVRVVLSAIADNVAGNGGGIACINARLLLEGSTIHGNAAATAGGGLYLDDCWLVVDDGLPFLDAEPYLNLRVADNTTTVGGGLYAIGGSRILFGESPNWGIAIAGNVASGRGGGIWLGGAGTDMVARALDLVDNTASQGAGAHLQDGSRLTIQRLPFLLGSAGRGSLPVTPRCQRPEPCNRVTGNRAVSNNGGAFFVRGSTLRLSQALIADNLSATQGGIVFTNEAFATISGSLITGHAGIDGSAREVLRVLHGSRVSVLSSTIAGNAAGPASIRLLSGAGGNQVLLGNSIIWQPDTPVIDATPADQVVAICNNANESAGIPAATHAPGFVDPGAGDFRVYPVSANVDACTEADGPRARDLIGVVRPFDLGQGNGPGPYDRGAYELGDRIFVDGFELPD